MFLWVGILFLSILSTQAAPKLRPLTGDVEQVTVNEIRTGRAARAVHECHFPHSLHFTFKVKEKKIILNLEKNVYLSRNVPVYVTNNGHSTREERNSSNAFALYQDVLHGSALIVTCQDDFSYRLHGSFRYEGIVYQMSHSNVPEPTKEHFVQPATETNIDFNDDTESPPAEHVDVRRKMFETISRQINDETPIPSGNIVEILFTVDKALYDRFSDLYGTSQAKVAIEQFAALLANEIDLYYCSVDMVDPDISIKIYLAGVVIPQVGTDVSWSVDSRKVIDGNTYIERLEILPSVNSWLSGESGLPQNDHVMALSTIDLADTTKSPVNSGYVGRAYVGTACSSSTSKVSFTEVRGKRDALIAAHELGHGLGYRHDTSTECPSTAKNIMTPSLASTTTITYAEAQWTFSSCSVASFKSHINGLTVNCLRQHAFTGTEFEQLQAKSLPGTIYSLTQQCQMYNGIWSTSCDSAIQEEDCYNGYHCSTSSSLPGGCQTSHFPLYPLAGTPCGAPNENKWCYRGRCVERTTTPTTTTTASTTSTTSSTSSTTICTTKFTSTTPSTSTTSTSMSPSTSTTTMSMSPSTSTTSTSMSPSTSTTSTTMSPSTSTTSTTMLPSTSTTSTSMSPTMSSSTTTVLPTTTTVAPCKKGKKCCVRVGKKKKCCKGPKCCKLTEASETDCYKSCCAPKPTGATTTTTAPCFKGKCCANIEVKGQSKKVCCKKAKCCRTKWGKETKCCLTCKK